MGQTVRYQPMQVAGASLGIEFFNFILALFTYEQDWIKALGYIGWSTVFMIIVILAAIPGIGWLFFVFYNVNWHEPLMEFFTIYPSWMTDIAWMVGLIFVIVLTIGVPAAIAYFYR
jgi:hypothetical protein